MTSFVRVTEALLKPVACGLPVLRRPGVDGHRGRGKQGRVTCLKRATPTLSPWPAPRGWQKPVPPGQGPLGDTGVQLWSRYGLAQKAGSGGDMSPSPKHRTSPLVTEMGTGASGRPVRLPDAQLEWL